MDYDDNDAQANNLQLAGEGRFKPSSVLRPYAFPRFGFGASLPGNLGFGSQVETEVFLGIQGQEDNQSLEDYSRGNNLIEFSSTVTDSCTISRRHDVWSEATSLESLEMLLKSVGQDTFTELDRLAKQMETNRDKDNINSTCSRAPDNIPSSFVLVSNFPTFESHLEENVLQTRINSLPQVSFVSAYEGPCRLGPSVPGDRYRTPMKEENSHVGSKCEEKGGKEAEIPIDESFNPQKCEASSGIVSASDHPKEINKHIQEGTDGLGQGTNERAQSQFMLSEARTNIVAVQETATRDAMYTIGRSVGQTSSLYKGHDDETIPKLGMETSVSGRHPFERQESFVARSQPECGEANFLSSSMILIDGNRDIDLATTGIEQVYCEMPLLVKGSCPILETKRDSAERLDHGFGVEKLRNLGEGSKKKDSKVTTSTSEPCRSRNEAGKQSVHNVDHLKIVCVDDSSLIGSVNEIKDKHGAGRAKELSGEFAMNAKESRFQGASGFVPVLNEDCVSVTRDDSIKLPVYTFNTTTAVAKSVDQGIESSIFVGCSAVDEKRPAEAQPETAAEMVSEINSFTEKRNDMDTGDICVDASMVEAGCVGEVIASQISINETSSSLNKYNQAENKVGRLIDSKDVHHAAGSQLSESKDVHHAAGSLLSEAKDAHHAVGTPVSQSEYRAASAMKEIESQSPVSRMSGDHSMGSESLLDKHDEIENKTGSGSAGHTMKQRDTLMVDQDKREFPLAADSLKCGPTMISSDNPSRDEQRKQPAARGSEVSDEFAKTEQCTSPCTRVQDISEDDNSFTFKVSALPEVAQRERGNTWTPFSNVDTYKAPLVIEQTAVRAPEASNVDKIDVRLTQETSSSIPITTLPGEENMQTRMPLETSGQSPKVSEGECRDKALKGSSGRKGRRALGKGAAEESSLKVNSQKERTSKKSSWKLEKSPNVPSPNVPSPNVPSNQVGIAMPAFTSSDSVQTPVLKQPFTDSQQVQLRAQIFVYGSLIQGVAPEEACMDSAFGSSDGGRSMWESVWRAAMERVHKQKFRSGGETPAHSDVSSSQQHKALLLPDSRLGNKSGLTSIVSPSPVMSLSSPHWSMSTPSHDSSVSSGISRSAVVEYQPAISPLHPFQTPTVRNFIGHSVWPSQPPVPHPLAAQASSLSPSIDFSTIPHTEPVKSNPMIDTYQPSSSVEKHVSNNLLIFPGGSRSAGPSSLLPSTDSKPRRRKKSQTTNDVEQSPLIFQSQVQQLSAPPSAIPTSPTVVVNTSASNTPTSASTVSPVCTVSNASSFPQAKIGNLDNRKDTTEDILRKVSEAKLQAEEATSLAASAVNHSQSVWNELSKQKESGAISEAEAKVVSAAVAVAAAASVAKAAAAAARVASNAALQAKLMADEALHGGSEKLPQSDLFSSSSFRKEDDGSSYPGSRLTAAREAAKRKKEEATAAAKQAENLEAIVRAAELASEAVAHAGNIVTMSKPFPLKDLIDSGPDGHWKLTPASSKSAVKSSSEENDQTFVSSKETHVGVKDACDHYRSSSQDLLTNSLHVHLVADNISQSVISTQNGQGVPRRHNVESSGVLAVPQSSLASGIVEKECEKLNLLHGYGINKGSPVEVYKHDSGLKPSWFSATALALEDGKVLVSYSGLQSDGLDHIKEWVSLDSEGGVAPRIRAAPGVASHSQETRKRRRTSTGDYTWNVGDRVDVQFQDCWWEGMVTETNDKDATTLTVHFPARGQTSAVRSWQLRPSRSWVDGKWIEFARSGTHHSFKEDLPHVKRQKFGSPVAVSEGKEILSETSKSLVGQPEEPEQLALGGTEKLFNIGRSVRTENKPDAGRTLRTGRQKQGSKVVLGVPKRGKKRRFVEVSKHYLANSNMAADNDEKHEARDPVKFSETSISRAVGICEQNNTTKIDSKTARKLSTATYRSMARRQKAFKPESAKCDENITEQRADIDDSKLQCEKPSSTSHDNDETEDDECPLSSLFHGKLGKLSSTSSKSERLSKRKLGYTVGKLSQIKEDEKKDKSDEGACESSEPRRSHRRIQPTHRLLEGLESSMIIPKMSSISHDKGSLSRSTTEKGQGM